jgi:hypothetical protein
MILFKIAFTSLVIGGIALAFTGLLVGGKNRVQLTFDEKIMDDMADPPWFV